MKAGRDRPFHILQVVHSLVIGGTERVVCDLTRHFNGERFRTSVCCLDDLGEFGKDLVREGVPVRVFNRRPGIDFSLLREIRSLYREWGIDLVHAHQYTPYFYGAAACLGKKFPKAVFTEHGRHQPDHVRPKRVAFNRILRMVTSGYTAVSGFTRQSLIDYEKMPGSRIRVIYNGVPSRSQSRKLDKKAAREKLGIGSETKVVLSVGRMDPIKDFSTLIRAFRDVQRDNPESQLLIAGGGDEQYLGQLRRDAERFGIGDKVLFLGSRRDVPELLTACDVFSLTSITEATSMTILEAMAAGRPVVATCTGGNPELVVDGKTGYLVPVGDHEAASGALARILKSPEQARKMGEAGKARFDAEFTIHAMLGSYKELYEEILRP